MKKCQTCKHWRNHNTNSNIGTCTGFDCSSVNIYFSLEVSDYGSAWLETAGEFGCIAHEEIEDGS